MDLFRRLPVPVSLTLTLLVCATITHHVAAQQQAPQANISNQINTPVSVDVAPSAYIGVMYSGSGSLASVGAATLRNMQLWKQLNPVFANGVTPVLLTCDVASSAAGSMKCFHQLLATQPNISVMIAPESSLVNAVAPLTDSFGIPLIASVSGLQELFVCDASMLAPCTKPYGPRFQTLFGNGATAAVVPLGMAPFLSAQGARTIAVVMGDDIFNNEVCSTFIRDALNNRMKLLLNITLHVSTDSCGNLTLTKSREAAEQIKALDPDIVVWCNRPCCSSITQSLDAVQYRPRALGASQCPGSDPVGFRYALDIATWDARALGNDYTDDKSLPYCNNFVPITMADGSTRSSAQLYANAFRNHTGGKLEATFTDAGIYAGFYVAQAALIEAKSLAPADVLHAMTLLNLPSFKGRLQVDSNRMINWGGTFFTQVSSAYTSEIVYPSSSYTASLIYPAPSFEEGLYQHKPFENLCEQLVVALAVILSICVIAFVIVPIARNHDTAPIRVIHPWLSIIALCGVIVSNLSVLTWTVHNTQSQCDARLWMWALGFSIMVTPLVGVFGHIQFIIGNNTFTLNSTIWRNPAVQLLCQLLIFVSVLVAWTVRAPFKLVPRVADPLRPSLNINECETTGWLPYGLIMLGLFLLVLTVLARGSLAIRSCATSRRFDRVREVLNASFLWIVLIGVLIILQYASTANVPATWMFTVRSLILLANNGLYTTLLFRAPLAESSQLRQKKHSAAPVQPIEHTSVAAVGVPSVHVAELPQLKPQPVALSPSDVDNAVADVASPASAEAVVAEPAHIAPLADEAIINLSIVEDPNDAEQEAVSAPDALNEVDHPQPTIIHYALPTVSAFVGAGTPMNVSMYDDGAIFPPIAEECLDSTA